MVVFFCLLLSLICKINRALYAIIQWESVGLNWTVIIFCTVL